MYTSVEKNMWITVLFLCFRIFPSIAQGQTGLDPQTVIDTSQVNPGVNWDNTRPAVTLNIRDGRSDKAYSSQEDISGGDQSFIYSNQWQPFLMAMAFNQYGDRNRYQTDTDYSADDQFVPTFLRRPDSDLNRIPPSNPNGGRGTFPSPPLPTTPILYYPQAFNFYPSQNTEAKDMTELQNSSNSTVPRSVPVSVTFDSEQNRSELLPQENSPITPGVPIPYPSDFYRNARSFMPPRIPAYIPPYPVLPLTRGDPFQPIINPNFLRKPGLEVKKNNSPAQDVSKREKQITSDDISDNEANIQESKQSETSVNIVPPPQIPFPVGGFPFGVGPFVPPFIPNAPPTRGLPLIPNVPISRGPFIADGLPFNPLPFTAFANVPQEMPSADGVLPQPIIQTNNPVESTGILPEVDDLQPQLETLTDTTVGAESVLQNEKPNRVKIPYEFGFDSNDGHVTDQNRKEVSDGSGAVTGSYGYRDMFGAYRFANYIVDKDGFRVESTGILPEVDDLQPELETLTDTKVGAESALQKEKPNTVKIPYEFGFDMNDGHGTDQHRKEVSDGSGAVTGSYGYRDVFGVYRLVNYIADKNGFRAFIKSNEPGVASSGSADVVVMAERPPPHAIAEGIKDIEPEAVIIADETSDLIAARSETV